MADEEKGDSKPESIPYERFQRVVSERNDLRDQLAAKDTEAQTLAEQAATAATLATQLEELRGQLTSSQAAWETERSLMESGLLDPEGREVAVFLHSKLPTEDRPAIGDWLSGFQGEGAEPPKALAPYLAGASESTSKPETGKPETTTRRSTDTGARSSTPTKGQWTPERVRELRLEAQASGDWSAYREARKHLVGERKR